MALRPYQQTAIDQLREKFRQGIRRVFYQLATGGGKTVIFTEITRLAYENNLRVWILVPRRKLLRQASEHLVRLKIPHGRINADCKESLAYRVHVVSRDTLMRRMSAGKVKQWPDVIISDEGHTGLEQQLKILAAAPDNVFFIPVSATPERLDGRGLSEIADDIILGPKYSWLVEHKFLSDMEYFCPPGFDSSQIKKRGSDYDAQTIEDLLRARQTYGSAIQHFKELGKGKPALFFCPSVKNSEETAMRFRDCGYKFESIDGKMSDKKLDSILGALADRQIDGVTSCDIATYGLDLPCVKYIGMLRKTISRALYFQIIGRGTRPDENILTVADHVGNFREHATGHAEEGDHVSKCFDVEWNFHGFEKNKRKKGEVVASLKLCDSCFLYFHGPSCPHCGTERGKKKDKLYKEIDGRLVEIKGPVKLKDRPEEDQREIQDQIGSLIDEIKDGGMLPGPIGELLKIAEKIGRNPMWVYWRLSEGMQAVNEPLLAEICRLKANKNGWIFFQRKEIKRRLGR